MIVWLLSKRGRKYVYIAMAVVIVDLVVGPMLVAWELKVIKELLDNS